MSIFGKRRCRHLITRTPDAGPPAPRSCRIAVFGGDARQRRRWADASGVRFFQSRRGGGNGELRRLVATVRSRSVDLVVVLARWNGHSASRKLRRVCRRYGVEFVLEP
jgi:hypothetical protein